MASNSLLDAISPRTILEEVRVAKGNVYTKNCGIYNKTISTIVGTEIFFRSIFWTNKSIVLTKKMAKKNKKATMKLLRNSFNT